MVSPVVQDALRAANWAGLRGQIVSHGNQMAFHCHPEFRALIAEVTNRFATQTPPSSDKELSARMLQANAVSSIVGTIRDASQYILAHPHMADVVLPETQTYCVENWPVTDEQIKGIYTRAIAFGLRLSNLCS